MTSASASLGIVNEEERTYVPGNAIDSNLSTFWNDANPATYPATLTITSLSAVTLSGIAFASIPDGMPVDFTITWNGSSWVQQAKVTGNDRVDRWIPFASPVSTDQVQLTVTLDQDAYSGEFTRVAELDPPPGAPGQPEGLNDNAAAQLLRPTAHRPPPTRASDFASLIDYSRSTIANVETGRQHVPGTFWAAAGAALRKGGALTEINDGIEACVRRGREEAARQTRPFPLALLKGSDAAGPLVHGGSLIASGR